MVFRIHLFIVCISLYTLLQYNINARTLELPKQQQNLGFSWGNCGPATDPIKIISLSLGPDPIRLPGNVVISTSLNITKAFPVDVNAKVGMEKKVFGFWISVPCEHDVGSCSYSVCTNKTEAYPDFVQDSNASKKCPSVPPAIYSVSNLVMDVTKSIPSIAEGDFRITINFDSSNAGHVACLHLHLSLKN